MYFMCDIYDNSIYGKIKSYKELKEQLISEVNQDLENNIQDLDIVSSCTSILTNIALGKDSLKYILDNLEGYGWKIIDLCQIQRDLEDLKQYFSKDDEMNKQFESIINLINNGK